MLWAFALAPIVGCHCAGADDVREAPWLETVQPLRPRRPLRGWALHRASGAPFSERDFVGRTSLVLVGYTRCPDVCPNTLSLLADVHQRSPETQVVFLSVDPEHDRKGLADYASFFDADFVALTGDRVAIDHAVDELGAAYTFVDGLVDHSTSLFVVDANANVSGVLLRPRAPDAVLRDLEALRDRRPPRVRVELEVPPRPPGAPGVAYGRIEVAEPVELVGITSPDVERVELHRTVLTATSASMVEVERLTLEPQKATRLEPGALHLMLLGTMRTAKPCLELHFATGSSALACTRAVAR